MKNKNGFTLVELLGVIVIIGILALISVPAVEKQLKDANMAAYDKQIDNIKSALTLYKQQHPEYFDLKENNYVSTLSNKVYLTVGELKSEGLLDNVVVDPRTDSMIPNDMLLCIYEDDTGYHFDVDDSTGTETPKYSSLTPYINLKSGKVRYVSLNSTYMDDEVDLKIDNGENVISNAYTVSDVNGGTLSIDTTTNGVYYVKYSIVSNNIPLSYIQTVIVCDTTSPVITIPEGITNVSLANVSSYDLMTGVTATDDVDGEITSSINVDGTLKSITGMYTVTYTVKDSNGNTTSKSRKFSIQ